MIGGVLAVCSFEFHQQEYKSASIESFRELHYSLIPAHSAINDSKIFTATRKPACRVFGASAEHWAYAAQMRAFATSIYPQNYCQSFDKDSAILTFS